MYVIVIAVMYLNLITMLRISPYFLIASLISAFILSVGFANAIGPTTVGLGTAGNFAILAGTPNITNVPTSVINGNVGLSPATGAGIGLTCLEVTGTIYSVDATGPLPCRITDPALLTIAKNDLTTAYNDAAGRTPVTTIATELGGSTLIPGVYTAESGTFGITGTLTLDGQGDPNSVFIFQMATTLTTASASNVVLTGSAQSCNIFWQVGSSATLGTNSTFRGNILALTSIAVTTGVTIDGRVLAQNGAVTLDQDTITRSTCAAVVTPTPTQTPTPSTPSVLGATPTLPNTGSEPSKPTNPSILLGILAATVGYILIRRIQLASKSTLPRN